MTSEEALENLRRAQERMKAAQEAHRSFIERPGRNFSDEERSENKRLLDEVKQSISGYWEAFEQAKRS